MTNKWMTAAATAVLLACSGGFGHVGSSASAQTRPAIPHAQLTERPRLAVLDAAAAGSTTPAVAVPQG